MAVDIEMVEAALLDATQGLELRQNRCGGAQRVHQLETPASLRRGDDPAQLREHALRRDAAQAARMLGGGEQRMRVRLEVQLDG